MDRAKILSLNRRLKTFDEEAIYSNDVLEFPDESVLSKSDQGQNIVNCDPANLESLTVTRQIIRAVHSQSPESCHNLNQ